MPSPPPLPALQMRFALHAPVQLLNFAAASLLFPAVCHDQLSAAGGPAGLAGHAALQLCLLRLGAKVRLLPAVLRCTPSACWCEWGYTLALATQRAGACCPCCAHAVTADVQRAVAMQVFLFAVVLPLMALRTMELGARAVFLHRWDAGSG